MLRVGAYVALVVLGMIAVIGPENLAWTGSFVARAIDYQPATALVPGDHLQLAYELWLWGDAVSGGGHAPWTDPYLYGTVGGGMTVIFGWPLVVVTVPVSLLWDAVAAYNVVVYLGFVLAALCTAAWVRRLGVSSVAAGAAGLAYAFAPFRVMQGVTHANALLAWMFPLLLLCLESALRAPEPRRATRWVWAAAAVLASIVLSGELHHAVFAPMLTAVYVAIRLPRLPKERIRQLLPAGVAGAAATVGAAALLYVTEIRPSSERGGRSIKEAANFAPRLADFVWPNWDQFERHVYIGAAIGVLALAAVAAALIWRRRRAVTLALGLGALVCVWFATAPSFVGHPTLQWTYRLIPFFSFSRVPGRLMVVGALLLAVLAGLGVDALGRRARPWLLVPLLAIMAFDLRAAPYRALAATSDPYRGLRAGAAILEVPVYHPSHPGASVYSWFVMRHPGRRVGGYFVIVPEDRDKHRARAAQLEGTPDDVCGWQSLAREARLDYVAVHADRFGSGFVKADGSAEPILSGLRRMPGFREVQTRENVTVFEVDTRAFTCDAGVSG